MVTSERVHRHRRPGVRRAAAASVLLLLLLACGSVRAAADAASDPSPTHAAPWHWPVDRARSIAAPFLAPAHTWSAGHRGVDIVAGGMPPGDVAVRAPAAGTIAFRGVVVDRPLLTIAHDGNLVTTLEPVSSTLAPGDAVRAGDVVGHLSTGGHASPGTLHLGVRHEGAYINPMALFGGVPRAILLPCCAPLP